MRTRNGYSTREAARVAQLTTRQIVYWAATRFVVPSVFDGRGKGNHIRWNFRDLLTLRVLAAFRDKGLSLQALRRVQRFIKSRGDGELQDVHARLLYNPNNTGADVLLARTFEEIISVLERPGQVVAPVVVDISKLYRDVQARTVKIEDARQERDEAQRAAKRAAARKSGVRKKGRRKAGAV